MGCDSQLHFVKLHKIDSTFPSRLVHHFTCGAYEWLICEQAILGCDANLMSLVHYSQSILEFSNLGPSCWVKWTNHRYRNEFEKSKKST